MGLSGKKFWNSSWNKFDALVVALSFLLAFLKARRSSPHRDFTVDTSGCEDAWAEAPQLPGDPPSEHRHLPVR
eukprot:128894-Rhodomonas_salina.1